MRRTGGRTPRCVLSTTAGKVYPSDTPFPFPRRALPEPAIEDAKEDDTASEQNRKHRKLVLLDRKVPDAFWKENKSGVACYNDTEPFTGEVFCIPLSETHGKYTVNWFFCSLACAKRYLISDPFLHSRYLALFSKMCREVYHITGEVIAAPHPLLLKKFCVTQEEKNDHGLTIDEYRKKSPSGILCNIVRPDGPMPFLIQQFGYSEQAAKTSEDFARTSDGFSVVLDTASEKTVAASSAKPEEKKPEDDEANAEGDDGTEDDDEQEEQGPTFERRHPSSYFEVQTVKQDVARVPFPIHVDMDDEEDEGDEDEDMGE